MYSENHLNLADVMLDLEECPFLFRDNPIVVLTVPALVLVGPPSPLPSEVLCQRTLQNPRRCLSTDDSDVSTRTRCILESPGNGVVDAFPSRSDSRALDHRLLEWPFCVVFGNDIFSLE